MASSKDRRAERLFASAVAEIQGGRVEQARLLCEQVLALAPRHPDALHMRGVIALQQGDSAGAIETLARAVAIRPDIAAYQASLGRGYAELQRLPEALAAFQRALVLEPGHPELLLGVGNCLGLLGRAAEAESALSDLVARHPRFPLGWYNLGRALDDQQRYEEASACYRRVTELAPQFPDAYNNLGNVLNRLARYEEAERAFRSCLALQPGLLDARVNLAIVLNSLRQHEESEALCRDVLARDPGRKNALPPLARALTFQHRWAEAVQYYERAVAELPASSETCGALGNALARTGRMREAMEAFDRAEAIGNVSVHTRFAKAVALFSYGRMVEGAAEFASRHERDAFVENHPERRLAAELPTDLRGQVVCLHGEQGIGDELFFLRYAPALKARGCQIVYHSDRKLMPLLERCRALDRVLPNAEPFADADHILFVGDLLTHFLRAGDRTPFRPRRMRRQRAGGNNPAATTSFPWHMPVSWPTLPPPLPLSPLPERMAAVTERLRRLGPPPYIGLTWRAGTGPEQQRGHVWSLFKEAPLEVIAASLRNAEGTLISVQRAPRGGETERLAALSGRPVHDFSAVNEDLEEMLALLAVLDEYVGVSNTNTHLRAGAGRTARVLVPWPAEWRWMAAGEESPWFPGFHIYREAPDGGWTKALERLAPGFDARALTYLRLGSRCDQVSTIQSLRSSPL